MRHVQHPLTPSVVHSHLHGLLLQHLRLNDYKRSVTARQLADLLILLAATARPLTAIVHARFAFCHEVARGCAVVRTLSAWFGVLRPLRCAVTVWAHPVP